MPGGWSDLSCLQAVLLDLDGTLVDTLGDFTASLHAMLADLELAGEQLSEDAVSTMVGKGSEHLIVSALRHVLSAQAPQGTDLTAEVTRLYPRAWTAYQHHYGRINGLHARVYPGVEAGLQRLRNRGLPLVCLTNKPQAFAQELLVRTGLRSAFVQVFGGDCFASKKPDPLPLQMSCQALSSVPARTLMVGDSLNDAQAARAAGCPVVLVSYGYNHGQPIRSVQADGYIDSLLELA